MTVKSLKKQLMAAIAMVLVATIALGSSTYAWFAANNIVTATNMQVTAQTSGSLVITNSALPNADTGTITVASSDTAATAVIPTTHDLTTATTTGLIYNTNPGDVSSTTGLQEGSTALAFAEAVNGTPTGSVYFLDYTVYIAATGNELTTQDLTITLTNAAVTTLPGATSIDFYYATVSSATAPAVSSSTFAGTLNLAGLDAATNDASTAKTQLVINGSGSGITIPKAGTSSAIAVLMRVYVDGALKDSATTTYIKNIDVAEIAAQTLGVQFEASDHS
jgi:hypothetical protein